MTQSSLHSNGHIHAATEQKHVVSKSEANPNIMIGLTLNLSWQLAVTVLLPVLGGHYLDVRLKTGYWLTVFGFGLAMIGMIMIIRLTLKQLNEYMKPTDDTEGKIK
jgi:capsular polysaccharide biosynthesis protein